MIDNEQESPYCGLFSLYAQMFFSGQPALMAEVFHALKSDNKNHVAFFFSGLCLFRFREYWKSFYILRSAAELDLKNYIYLRVVTLLAAYLGYDQERIFYAKYLDTLRPVEDPIILYVENRLGDELPFIQLINEGDRLLVEENFDLALEKYSEALEKRFANMEVLRRISSLLKQMKRYHEALGFARGILESAFISPEDNLLISDLLACVADFQTAQSYAERSVGNLVDSFLTQRTIIRQNWMNPESTNYSIFELESKLFPEIKLSLNKRYGDLFVENLSKNLSKRKSRKLHIGFLSGRFMTGMGLDPVLNFIPILRQYADIICFNTGYQTTIAREYRNSDIEIIHFPSIAINELAQLIRDHKCDVVIDLDGYSSITNIYPEIFFYQLAPLMIQYQGTSASLKFRSNKLLYTNRSLENNTGIINANLFSFPYVLPTLDITHVLSKRQYPDVFCVGISAYPWEINDYLLHILKRILEKNAVVKIIFFYHKLGGYLSFLKLTDTLEKMNLKKRIAVSPISTGVFFSYRAFINEIDCLLDFSVTNAIDEAYYTLQMGKPVWSVRGNYSRQEVANMLDYANLNSYVLNKDDDLVNTISAFVNFDSTQIQEQKEEIKELLSKYDTEKYAKELICTLRTLLQQM